MRRPHIDSWGYMRKYKPFGPTTLHESGQRCYVLHEILSFGMVAKTGGAPQPRRHGPAKMRSAGHIVPKGVGPHSSADAEKQCDHDSQRSTRAQCEFTVSLIDTCRDLTYYTRLMPHSILHYTAVSHPPTLSRVHMSGITTDILLTRQLVSWLDSASFDPRCLAT